MGKDENKKEGRYVVSFTRNYFSSWRSCSANPVLFLCRVGFGFPLPSLFDSRRKHGKKAKLPGKAAKGGLRGFAVGFFYYYLPSV